MEAEQPAPTTEVDEENIDAMFAAKKKKKKAKAKDFEATLEEATDGNAGAGSSASATTSAAGGDVTVGASLLPPTGGLAADETEEPYEEMLGKLFRLLTEHNPELLGREKKRVKPPQVSRVGTTRSAWTNFKDICAALKRSHEHVLSFYLAELGTTGAIDGSDRLLLKGKFLPKAIESLLLKYVAEYVQCHMCRNTDTELTRDPISRLYFINCKACNSTRSVAPIKAGYHATAKGERKKAREAQG